MMHLSRQLLSGAALAAFATQVIAAAPAIAPSALDNQNYYLPLTPRITGMGLLGDDQTLMGDAMAALWGNQDRIFYMDIQSKTAFDTDWSGSLGAGVRAINNDQRIFGAYVFADRTISSYDNEFWFISPGIETLGQSFDFHVNGYFPINSKRQYGYTDWADNFGVYDYVTFADHTQYDVLMTQDEEVGWGGDAEIGVPIPGSHNIRVYAGGYHFNFNDAADINGVAARIEIPVNRYVSLTARNSYDNVQNNTFMAGVKITLGGVNVHPRDPHQAIQERILDPIERNMATLGQGASAPIQNILTPVPSPILSPQPVEKDHIWFFLPGSTNVNGVTLRQCTYEHPCVGLNQNTINSISVLDPNATFYFAPGQYFPIAMPLPAPGILTVADGQTFWGRKLGYILPADGANRAVINGVLQLSGNNILDSLQIINSSVEEDLPELGVSKTGIHILASGNAINLNNINIQVTNNDLNNAALSLFSEGNGGVVINNSSFTAMDNAITSLNGAENIIISGNNSFAISNSNFNATTVGNLGAYNIYNVYNEMLATTAVLNISTSTINATSLGGGGSANILLSGPNSRLNLDQSALTTTAYGSIPGSRGALNIFMDLGSVAIIDRSNLHAINSAIADSAVNIDNSISTLTLSNSSLTATDSGGVAANGVLTVGGDSSINNSIINTSELGGNPNPLLGARGVYAQGGTVRVDNTQINVTANTDTPTTAGVYMEDAIGTVKNSSIQVTQQGSGSEVSGLIASINGTLSVDQIRVNVNATTSATVFGAIAVDGGTINIENGSEFQVSSATGGAIGAYTYIVNTGAIFIKDSNFNILSSTGQAAGIQNYGTMTIEDSNFLINGNGSSEFNTGTNSVTPVGGSCLVNGSACSY